MTAASSPTSATRHLALRRIGATLIDWLWILLYLWVLAVIGGALYLTGVRFPDVVWSILIPLLTVVPVTVAIARRETGARAATPGKDILGLVVTTRPAAGDVTLVSALIRNAVKIGLPWQLGHMTAQGMIETFVINPHEAIPLGLWVVTGLTYLLVVLHVVMLFTGSRRPFYDRLAGTTVVERAGL